ncbi:MAG: saccharopine dehydrogenase NADP-binding domain-containing protein [Myxococcales bacterium]|nr:saccharopine dehydrogenase NADP-binding domain-containing protein [Myxococcales bacterium]
MIVIYGASGAIGHRIAAALVDRGAEVRLAGRDRVRLLGVADELGLVPADVCAAPIHDPAALARAFADATCVVSAAGPYGRVGAAVAAAALAADAHYLDLAIEPGFVRTLYEEHESEARRRARCVVSGLGTLGALGDWAADAAAGALPAAPDDDAPLDEIEIAYAFDGARFATGMARSLVATLAGPALAWRRGRWDQIDPTSRGRTIDFGELGARRARALATTEAVTVPRRWAVRQLDTFVAPTGAPWLDRAIGAAAPLLRWLPGAAATVEALIDPGRAPADAADAAARFAVVARARRGDAQATVAVSGADVYATSAAIVSRLAHALATGALDGGGVLTPSQLLAGERALGATPDLVITRVGP